MDIHELAGIPVLARSGVQTSDKPIVIVIHGMSTTAETLRAGWPDPTEDGLDRIYWRLPVLREGREAVLARREEDLFRRLFWPVVDESRRELTRLIGALGARDIGLFGFSIGGLISLWGGLDNPQVKGCVAVGGVPYLEYLPVYYPEYDWAANDVQVARQAIDLRTRVRDLSAIPTLILHGLSDDQADWEWMRPFAEALSGAAPDDHTAQTYPLVRHRLTGADGPEEEAQLVSLRQTATDWLAARLGAHTAL